MKIYDNDLPSSIYSTIRLFGFDLDVPLQQVSIPLWVAAYGATITMATFLVGILRTMRQYLKVWLWGFCPEAIARHTNALE